MISSPVPSSLPSVATWPPDAVRRYVAKGYWEGYPLGERFLAAADAGADNVALVDGMTRLSYRELAERADGTAQRLEALGLRPGDRIVVQLPNCWEFVALTLACFRLGVVPVMALPAHRKHEISNLAKHAEAVAIAVPSAAGGYDYPAMALEIASDRSTVQHVLVAGAGVRYPATGLTALCAPAANPAAARAALDRVPPDSRATALFLLSGGTTGPPKLIPRTHNDYVYNAKRSGRICGFGAATVYLAVLPLSHNFALGCPGVLGTLLAGGRVVIGSSPAPATAFATIERERVTAAAVVPTVVHRWLEYRESGDRRDLSSLLLLQVGGARLANYAASRVEPAFGCMLQQVYGMAEGLLNFTRLDDPAEVTCTTQGRPMCPDDEILIVDEAGQPVPPGSPGVLLTRGPYTIRGYYRAAETNSRAFTPDGWYRTGDVVRMRTDGYLVVHGRNDDIINRGGEKISPEEVENFAYQVPGVSAAAVVAMPDPEFGERVCLYVVPQPGVTVTLAEVRNVMELAGVARFKLPERLISVDSLPGTNIGKINKKELRADIAERLARER